jgi:hypothetical protein
MGFRSMRDLEQEGFQTVEGSWLRLKPRRKISKTGSSWMKETLDFSF